MNKTISYVCAAALTLAVTTSPLLAQSTPAGSQSATPSTTAPSDRTSQSGLQPSTQQTKEPSQTGTVAKSNRQAQKKVDDQHK